MAIQKKLFTENMRLSEHKHTGQSARFSCFFNTVASYAFKMAAQC